MATTKYIVLEVIQQNIYPHYLGGQLKNIRCIGSLVAADLMIENNHQRVAYKIYQRAIELGAFMRPIGNTIYWLPPLNTSRETLKELQLITCRAITDVLN